MTKQEKLLDKYYKGETSLEEEKELKILSLEEETDSSEKDIFGYFEAESKVPSDLEEQLFKGIEASAQKGRSIRMRILSIASSAALLLLLVTVYLNIRNTRNTKLENDFFVMEQALFQISESIQPQEQEEMLVLWVDDDVEIIIN